MLYFLRAAVRLAVQCRLLRSAHDVHFRSQLFAAAAWLRAAMRPSGHGVQECLWHGYQADSLLHLMPRGAMQQQAEFPEQRIGREQCVFGEDQCGKQRDVLFQQRAAVRPHGWPDGALRRRLSPRADLPRRRWRGDLPVRGHKPSRIFQLFLQCRPLRLLRGVRRRLLQYLRQG